MKIDRDTGALVLDDGRRIDRDTTLAQVSRDFTIDALGNGWAHAELPGARLLFEGEQLAYYNLWIVDARYGTSWDDWSEAKELARRDAQDAWLVEMLGPGVATTGTLTYTFAWGGVWSSYDPKGGSSMIGVRFNR